MIPQSNHRYNTWSSEDFTIFYCRTDVFRYSYFPYTILDWDKLDMQIRRSESFLCFENYLLKIGWPTAKPTDNIYNPIGWKFLTRLKLGLNNHKFKHYFQEFVSPLCSSSLEIESLFHFFLHCHHFTNMHVAFSKMICSQLI